MILQFNPESLKTEIEKARIIVSDFPAFHFYNQYLTISQICNLLYLSMIFLLTLSYGVVTSRI